MRITIIWIIRWIIVVLVSTHLPMHFYFNKFIWYSKVSIKQLFRWLLLLKIWKEMSFLVNSTFPLACPFWFLLLFLIDCNAKNVTLKIRNADFRQNARHFFFALQINAAEIKWRRNITFCGTRKRQNVYFLHKTENGHVTWNIENIYLTIF